MESTYIEKEKSNKKTIWQTVLVLGILFGIINSLVLSSIYIIGLTYSDTKDVLLVILFNVFTYYLLAVSLYKIEKENRPIWLILLLNKIVFKCKNKIIDVLATTSTLLSLVLNVCFSTYVNKFLSINTIENKNIINVEKTFKKGVNYEN